MSLEWFFPQRCMSTVMSLRLVYVCSRWAVLTLWHSMQVKFILLWSSLASLWLPRRYTVRVGLPHITGPSSISPLQQCLSVASVSPAGGCVLSVAVVKNSSVDIRSLQGLKSCHSGLRWTAGWSLPLAFLLSRNLLSWSKEQPLSHGTEIVRSCMSWTSPFSVEFSIGPTGFQSHHCPFLLSSRGGHLFQSQLHSRSCCPGATSVHSVPGPEVLHSPEELPLRDVSQRALLQQSGGPQVRLDLNTITVSTCGPSAAEWWISSLASCAVTDVSGVAREMLHLWTI